MLACTKQEPHPYKSSARLRAQNFSLGEFFIPIYPGHQDQNGMATPQFLYSQSFPTALIIY